MYTPIRDYGIIGNLRSAALISKEGSIDWRPHPYLDSPSVFSAILDDKKGGRWKIAPSDPYKSEQEYLGQTNILITRFHTEKGVLELTDFMPAQAGREMPEVEKGEIRRRVSCQKGSCRLLVEFEPRFNFARGETKILRTSRGLKVEHEGQVRGELLSPSEYSIENNVGKMELDLKEGDFVYLTFHYHEVAEGIWPGERYEHELLETKKFWEDWVHKCDQAQCPFAGPYHDLVVRSSLMLKILFFEPPGSIAASATTSLPEVLGGVRNWDYQFSWIRDSSFALQALILLGQKNEAARYLDWLLKKCCSTDNGFEPQEFQALYGLRGEKDLTEEVIDNLEGYKGSKPVRVGNAAFSQNQWDIYGSLADTVWRQVRLDPSYELEPETWGVLLKLANYVCQIWREPDESLWEIRDGKKHYVYSKVMCWVALDRVLKIAEHYGFEGETKFWLREMKAIHKEVVKRGWSEKRQAFAQSFDSDELDASLLLMPILGFISGQDERMISTIEAVQRELSVGNGLLLRYKNSDGLPGKEGAFLLCSFWLVDALVFAGQKELALKHFDSVAKMANHLGLYSEEIDPEKMEFLGNFPQAYTHIGLINSVFYLSGSGTNNK